MKATEQSVISCGVMSIMLHKVVLTSDPMVTILMKPTEQYLPAVLFTRRF